MNKKELASHLSLVVLLLVIGWMLGCGRKQPLGKGIFLLLGIFVIYRMIDYICRYFRMKRIWLYFIDIGMVPLIAGLLQIKRRSATYEVFTVGEYGPFDFFDLCIGIGITGMIFWYICYLLKYYPYHQQKEKGMTFREKMRWEWHMASWCLRAPFLPTSRWEYDSEIEKMEKPKEKAYGKVLIMAVFGITLCGVLILAKLKNYHIEKPELADIDSGKEGDKEQYTKDVSKEQQKSQSEENSEEDTFTNWLANVENKSQQYPLLLELPQDATTDDYIRLFDSDLGIYEVKEGDTLWNLAKQYYHRGTAWKNILENNPQLSGDGSLIYPGMKLGIQKQIYYISRQKDSLGGFESLACHFDAPRDWTYSYPEWEVCLENWSSSYQDSVSVYTHITENRIFQNINTNDWEEMQKQITKAMEAVTEVELSNLSFERYYKEDGKELLFYTFECDNKTEKMQYAVAYVCGDRYLAEFIGCAPMPSDAIEYSSREDMALENHISYAAIGEITRYMAASYEEKDGDKTWASLKYRPYLGHEVWPWEDLHNPFAIAKERHALEIQKSFEGEDKELSFVSKKWQNLLYNIVSTYNHMDESQWKELTKRPLRTSDLAFIEEVELVESVIPGRDTICFSTDYNKLSASNRDVSYYEFSTIQDLAVLPNLKKVTLEVGGISDYDILGNCSNITELSISSEELLTDLSWLKKLPNLKSLTLEVSDVAQLRNRGYLSEEDSTFEGHVMQQGQTKAGALEETLAACEALEYLELHYSGTLDLQFLEKLPNLYAFCLYPEEDFGEEAKAIDRAGNFAEDFCPQIKCLVVDGTWIRNPE